MKEFNDYCDQYASDMKSLFAADNMQPYTEAMDQHINSHNNPAINNYNKSCGYVRMNVTRGTKLLFHIKTLINELDGNQMIFDIFPTHYLPILVDAVLMPPMFAKQFEYFRTLINVQRNIKNNTLNLLNDDLLKLVPEIMYKNTNTERTKRAIDPIISNINNDIKCLHQFVKSQYEDYFIKFDQEITLSSFDINRLSMFINGIRSIFTVLSMRYEFMSLISYSYRFKDSLILMYVQTLKMILSSIIHIIGCIEYVNTVDCKCPDNVSNPMPNNFKILWIRKDVYNKRKSIAWHIHYIYNRPDIHTIYDQEDLRYSELPNVQSLIPNTNLDTHDISTDTADVRTHVELGYMIYEHVINDPYYSKTMLV